MRTRQCSGDSCQSGVCHEMVAIQCNSCDIVFLTMVNGEMVTCPHCGATDTIVLE